MSTGTLVHKVIPATVTKGLAPRQFRFTISSDSVDRDGDRIFLDSWDLSTYKTNPIVLAFHDAKSLPVGRSVDIGVARGTLQATVEFPPPGLYDFADTVHGLVDSGFLRAASVGFISRESTRNDYGGHDITKASLCEWSIVGVGSNPDALVQRAAPVQMQRWLKSTAPYTKEGYVMRSTDWIEIDDDEPFFELIDTKDRSLFEIMCDQMLAAYSEMDSEKFRELMARQLALLGPAASIVDLVHALAQQGVAAPRSAPGFRHLSQLEQINKFNESNQQYERDKELARTGRWHRPSFSMY
jgi:hypothetical protein